MKLVCIDDFGVWQQNLKQIQEFKFSSLILAVRSSLAIKYVKFWSSLDRIIEKFWV